MKNIHRVLAHKDASWREFQTNFLPFVQKHFTSKIVTINDEPKLVITCGDNTAEFKLFHEGEKILGYNRWEAEETTEYLAYFLLEIIWWGHAEYELGFLKSPYYNDIHDSDNILSAFEDYLEVTRDCNRLHALCGTQLFKKLVELEITVIRNGKDKSNESSRNDN
jgi:hypothetical protein